MSQLACCKAQLTIGHSSEIYNCYTTIGLEITVPSPRAQPEDKDCSQQ